LVNLLNRINSSDSHTTYDNAIMNLPFSASLAAWEITDCRWTNKRYSRYWGWGLGRGLCPSPEVVFRFL